MNNARSFTIYRGVDFGPVVLPCTDSSGNVVNATDYTAYSQIRTYGGCLVRDLTPTVSNGAAGEVTIPAISAANTANMPLGRYGFDVVLADTNGVRTGPYWQGPVVVSDISTRL